MSDAQPARCPTCDVPFEGDRGFEACPKCHTCQAPKAPREADDLPVLARMLIADAKLRMLPPEDRMATFSGIPIPAPPGLPADPVEAIREAIRHERIVINATKREFPALDHQRGIDELWDLWRDRLPNVVPPARPHGHAAAQAQDALDVMLRALSALPAPADTPDQILFTCESMRTALAKSAPAGGRGVRIDTRAASLAFLRGEYGNDAYLLPTLEPLWTRALALNLGNVPAFAGEPQNAPAAFERLDALMDWCRRQSSSAPPADGQTASTADQASPNRDALADAADAAYRPATELMDADPNRFPAYNAVKKHLKQHPEIRTRKPSKQRLEIHAGDWLASLQTAAGGEPAETDEGIQRRLAAAAQEKRKARSLE